MRPAEYVERITAETVFASNIALAFTKLGELGPEPAEPSNAVIDGASLHLFVMAARWPDRNVVLEVAQILVNTARAQVRALASGEADPGADRFVATHLGATWLAEVVGPDDTDRILTWAVEAIAEGAVPLAAQDREQPHLVGVMFALGQFVGNYSVALHHRAAK